MNKDGEIFYAAISYNIFLKIYDPFIIYYKRILQPKN